MDGGAIEGASRGPGLGDRSLSVLSGPKNSEHTDLRKRSFLEPAGPVVPFGEKEEAS